MTVDKENKLYPQIKLFDINTSEYESLTELIDDICTRNDLDNDKVLNIVYEFKKSNNKSDIIIEL